MSVLWLGRAWETTVGSPTRKAVLIALADRCGEEGICWPSYGDIMFRTELGRTTVKDALYDLEVDGFIETWERERPDGSNTSKGYRLLIPGVSRGVVSRPGGVASRPGGGSAADPRTEPSVEPSSDRPSRGAARRRATTAERRPKGRVRREADDHGDDESPALGASPRASKAERNEVAAVRGTSGVGLALRLQRGLAGQPGSAATVDVGVLGKQLAAKVKAGTHTYDQLAACIEVYLSAPERYRTGDRKGWTAFLAALPKLEANAAKRAAATQPAAERYADPYEGVR